MSLNSIDVNSTVVQSAAVAATGVVAMFIDRSFPDPVMIVTPSQIPMVAAEIIGQIALNGIVLKLVSDNLSGYYRNTSSLPLYAATVFPLVQPRLMKKLYQFYNGITGVLDVSMAKVPTYTPVKPTMGNATVAIGGQSVNRRMNANTNQLVEGLAEPTPGVNE